MGTRWKDGYSSDVEIYLDVEGETYEVAQAWPGSFILRTPLDAEPETPGTLIIKIDGHEHLYMIILFEGAKGIDRPTRFVFNRAAQTALDQVPF